MKFCVFFCPAEAKSECKFATLHCRVCFDWDALASCWRGKRGEFNQTKPPSLQPALEIEWLFWEWRVTSVERFATINWGSQVVCISQAHARECKIACEPKRSRSSQTWFTSVSIDPHSWYLTRSVAMIGSNENIYLWTICADETNLCAMPKFLHLQSE